MSVIEYYLINPNEPDALDLLCHLYSDFNQDPYPEATLTGSGVYHRPDATLSDTTVEVNERDE